MCLAQLEKDHTHCYTVCFHLFNKRRRWLFLFLFFSQEVRWKIFFFPSPWSNLCFYQFLLLRNVRRPLRKTFIYLVPSLVYLPPPRLFAWLAAELTDCLDGWLPLSLDSHWQFTHTLRELRWGWGGERRQSGCSGFGKWDSLLGFSLCLFRWTIRWEQGNSLGLSPPALTTDLHYCAASMTLHTWLVYGLGFILVWTLCLTQGEPERNVWRRISYCMEAYEQVVHACVCACTCMCRFVSRLSTNDITNAIVNSFLHAK